MKNRDYQDLIGGLLLIALGIFVIYYSQRYDFGTPARMGPGFFPTVLGWMLAGVGLLVALPAWFRPGPKVVVQWKNALFVLGAIVLFALLLRNAGLIVATLVAAFVGSLADKEITWVGRAVVSIGVTAVTWAIFIVGLSIRVPVWPWSY
jgi:Na+/melibiose symporter-like transporter